MVQFRKLIFFILLFILHLLPIPPPLMNSQLNILFLSDIHLSLQNVEKLFNWHQENNIKFDLILIGGDTANCDQTGKTHDEMFQEKQANLILTSIQQRFNCMMYFIPGNHDPLLYYNQGYNINENIVSCHEKRISIAEGLDVIGFGGSVPGYLDKERKEQTWKGYPFQSNQALSEYLKTKKIFPTKQQQTQTQSIYLTHCGPFDVQTSIDRRKVDSPIYGGAVQYNDLVLDKNLVMHLHGHVHFGSRYARLQQVPIINPGPLLYGQFAYIVLSKNEEQNNWKYHQSHFVQL